MPRRILVLEDDHFQRAALIEVLQDRLADSGGVEVIEANSESAAYFVLDEALKCGWFFDAYILDRIVPWSQEDVIPARPDRVRTEGSQMAGFRVADRIKDIRGQLVPPASARRDPPIVLYTINDDEFSRAFHRPDERCYTFIKREVDPDGVELHHMLFRR
jgi:CheY-like chemotaxis protein